MTARSSGPTGVAILGATGSIGASALAVLSQHPDRFRAVGLSANRNAAGLSRLIEQWRPEHAVLVESEDQSAARGPWRTGREALIDLVSDPAVDIVVNALVGAAGLEPTLMALRSGKRVALANKESLVCGGELVLEAARAGGGEIIPVDSEHSAIFQCLQGSSEQSVERVFLTASGGPFRTMPDELLGEVEPGAALRHPTWDMGAKVTIDSATLANKALEVIEAHFLFGIGYDRISVVVHPQSIVHSMVEFVDGSVLAQMGFPTMEIPILYALAYPDRLPYRCRRFDPVEAGALTFEPVRSAFRAFSLGVEAGREGGTAPAVYNAANEVAVAAFLAKRLGFTGIASAIENTLANRVDMDATSVEAVLAADNWARRTTESFIEELALC